VKPDKIFATSVDFNNNGGEDEAALKNAQDTKQLS
jgi:hypothetical protein